MRSKSMPRRPAKGERRAAGERLHERELPAERPAKGLGEDPDLVERQAVRAGELGAASYTFPNGWFSQKTKGPKNRGKNYFFGGTVPNATTAAATIGKQTIALPAAAVGKKATLSGWLGNYVNNRAQVRAEFADAAGKVLLRIRIGPDTTIAGTDMAFRTRNGKVPAGATNVTIVVTFAGGGVAYKLAGADALALILS